MENLRRHMRRIVMSRTIPQRHLGPAPVLSAAEGAIQYVPQGPGIGKKFDHEKQPLTPELKAKGISEEDHTAICELLRTAFGLTGIDGSFSKAITKANEEYFEKVGCVACYAEYYKGCKVLSPALVLILALALIRTLVLTLKAMVVAPTLALALIRTLTLTLKAMVVFTKEAADGGAVEYMK